MNENELYHFGVPGMKWGHRKAQVSGGSGKLSRKQYKAMKKDLKSIGDREYAKAEKKYVKPVKITKRATKEVSRNDMYRAARDDQYTNANRVSSKNTKKKMIQKYGKESYDQFINQRSKKNVRKARLATAAIVAGVAGYKLNKAGINPMSVATKAAYKVGQAQAKATGAGLSKMGYSARQIEKLARHVR